METMLGNLSMDAKNWIFTLHESLPRGEFIRMVVTLWAIWGSRRKAIHKDIFQSPISTNGFINSYLGDLHVLKPIHQIPSVVAATRATRWIRPDEAAAKVNVDAAVSRRGFGAVGAICRDQNRIFLGASSFFPEI